MRQTEYDEDLYAPIPLGPELPEVRRRVSLHTRIVLGMAATIPVAVLAYGCAKGWRPDQGYWLEHVAVSVIFAGIVAAYCVYRIRKRSKKDLMVRVEFAPTFLTIVRRYSRLDVDYNRITGMSLVYLPVRSADGIELGASHRSMRLFFFLLF